MDRRALVVGLLAVAAIAAAVTAATIRSPAPPPLPVESAVPEQVDVVPDRAEDCPQGEGASRCLQVWALANLDSIDEVIATLTARSFDDPEFSEYTFCHSVWHVVGEEAGRVYDLGELLAAWPYSCYGGLLHGAMSTAAHRVGAEEMSASARAVCDRYRAAPRVVELDCWHGIGHAFAQVLEFPASMEACVPVAPDPDALEWCTWGAAETAGDEYLIDGVVAAGDVDAVLGLCEEITVGEQACARIQAPVLAGAGWSSTRLIGRCLELTGADAQRCGFAAGQVIGVRWAVVGEPLTPCFASEVLAEVCVEGAARSVGRADEANQLAASSRRDGLAPGEVLSLCRSVPVEVRSACEASDAAIRDLELSPDEVIDLLERWWDLVERPEVPPTRVPPGPRVAVKGAEDRPSA
jgi:hypothetical protein